MIRTALKLKGTFKIELIRDGKIIHESKGHNGVTEGGLDAILDIMFHNDTQLASWYCGLVDNAGTPALAAGDTMASHAGWTEVPGASVDEAVRETWTEDAASGQSISNTTVIEYNFAGTQAVYGIFITSGSAFAGVAGTLWATGAFAAVVNAVLGDILRVTYTVSIS